MSDQPPPTSATSGSSFCAECGAALPADARFCGSCGAAPPGAAVPPGAGADPTEVGGASTWQGVAPIVERDPTEAIPTVPAAGPPPGPGGPPPGPPVGGPPTAPAPPGSGKGKGPLVAAIVVVLALLAGGAFFLLGGDDDGDDDEQAEIDREDDEDDEETTTTTEADDEEATTTTAGSEETSTTAADDGGGDLTFVRRQDDSGTLVVEVPDFWEVNGLPLADGSPNLVAAESIALFLENAQSSGLSYTRLPGTNADPDATIDFLANTNNLFDSCSVEERQDYDDGVFVGRSQQFSNCQPSGATIFEVVGTRADGVSVEVTIALAPGDDPAIIDQIQRTFNLTA